MFDLIGQHIGQYEIIAPLGKGGMSTVYEGRQASLDRRVAIKVIKLDLIETSEFLQRLSVKPAFWRR